MYSRKVDCEIFYDRRESIGSSKSSSFASDYGSSTDGSSASSDHYNPTLRLLQIPRSSNGSMGFHLTRSKWDPYPWISAVDKNTPAKFHGLKAGDCVLEVNGEDILGMRISEIADLVNSETKTIDNVALLLWSPGSDNNCNPRNLCCGPMPLNLERLTAFTQTILAIIECPVCLETIAPPILQCQNGHILCVKCRILSHICPVCRQHFYPGRSLVAEQIYNSITDTFNLRSPDKSQGYYSRRDQLFGAKYKRSSSISISTSLSSASTVSIKDERRYQQRRRRSEKQQNNSDIRLKSTLPPPPTPPLEVNKFESHQGSTNKFLTKLLGRAYSMDNLSSSTRCRRRCRRQSAPLLSLTRITIGRIADDNVGSKDIDEYNIDDENVDVNGVTKANCNSTTAATTADFNEQLEFTNLCRQSTFEPRRRPTLISKQFSLSAHDLSKKDNDGLIAIQQQQHECLSKNRLQYLWLERSSVQMTILPSVLPLLPGLVSSSELGSRKISLGSVKHLKDGRPLELEPSSCCTAEQVVFLCPFSCGKQFSGPALHQHIKVDHTAPILCYNSSSAELALPLRAPLDKAAVLLMCDGKDFWIKLRTHGREKNITAFAVFQGPEDESSDFMMETRLRNHIDKDQGVDEDDDDNQCYHPKADANDDDDDDYVKIVVNNDNGILERELITRSIVRSMNVATWEHTSYSDADDGSSKSTEKDVKCRDFLYNQKDIQLTFGEAIDYRNLLLKIIIKKR